MPITRSSTFAVSAFLLLTACIAAAADKPTKKKEAAVGKTPKSPELVVWSGNSAPGQTWAKMGPNGSLKVADKAGVGKSGKGLELRFDGDGWRGCGVNWKGWFPEDACDDASRFTSLVFQIRQISKSPRATLNVSLVDNVKRADGAVASDSIDVLTGGGLEKIDGTWHQIVIPLENFARGKPLQLSRLWGIDFSNDGGGDLVFQIDQIGFSDAKPASPRFSSDKSYRATVSVSADKELYPISENIYGLCGWPRDKLVKYGIKITRWGGNPSTRYNWKLNVDNGASDWFFKNRGQLISQLDETGYLKHILGNQSFGATTYQTVPMIGWVAKDAGSYGFSVAKYGAQKATEPGQPDVGNGLRADGSTITGNDPRETSVPAPPDFIEEAVRFVASKAGNAAGASGKLGVQYWALDNEPALWNSTHRDVHPQPLTYDELWERTVQYAEAIRRADPTAKIAGYCSWGWLDLFYSAADSGSDSFRTQADSKAHGGEPMAVWFLKNCADYRRKTGKPLLDVFDVHWYPQGQSGGQGVYQGKGVDPQLCALRLRSTADLWDEQYQQESWIKDAAPGKAVALIPRIRNWIDKHNPGMEISLGEYNFGGADNISGALAQTDVLGIFGREKLNLAFLWHTPEGTQELGWQILRDYDGKQSRFGDRALAAKSNQSNLAVYAALRSSDQALTVVFINKNLHGACVVDADLGTAKGTLSAWRFDQETDGRIVPVQNLPKTPRTPLLLELPPASATMVVVTP